MKARGTKHEIRNNKKIQIFKYLNFLNLFRISDFGFRILSATLISITTFALIFAPLVHAGWFDVFKQSAGLIQGFGGVPGVSGGGGSLGSRVPVFDEATEEIKKKEVGTKKISIPGVGSANFPIPGASGSLDGIAYQLARMAINKITKDIVNWIRTGGRGSKPLFVTNWEDFLKDVANEASGIFIQDLELTEICQPFKPRLQLLLGSGRAPYYQRAQCTIRDVARNVENFYRDFKQGGWTRWFEITMIPQNNFYGSYYLALEEKLLRESGALEAKKSEAIAGGGFLGQEKCVSVAKRKSEGGSYPDDFEGPMPCLSWQTVTPGTLIQDQLEEVFSSDIRQLELADEIDEIIAAAFQRLFSELRKSQQGVLKTDKDSEDPITIFGQGTQSDVSTAKQQVSNSVELSQAIALSQQTIGVKENSVEKVEQLVGILEEINSCAPQSADSRIETSKKNVEQLKLDVENINTVTSQLQQGEQELASANDVQTIYTLFADLREAVDSVISLYDSAVAENSQIAGEIASAEQELEQCQTPQN